MIKDALRFGVQLIFLFFLVVVISMVIYHYVSKDLAFTFALVGGIIVGIVQLLEVHKIVKRHLN